MQFTDLRDFMRQLEHLGELKRVSLEVDPNLEITEICDRTLRAGGPALLFERVKGSPMPLLGNLFGTPRRVALGMGADSVEALREIGRLLAFLKEPDPPKGMKDAWEKLPIFRKVLDMAPKSPALRRLPGRGQGRRRGGPVRAADPDLLARRRRPADHLGPGGHPGSGKIPPEPGHLPHAGDRPQPRHHALAGPPRRRPGLPRLAAGSTRASPSRSPWPWAPTPPPSWPRSRRCRTPCPSTPSPACCAAAAPKLTQCLGNDLQVPASARDHPGGPHRTRTTRRRKGPSATTPATTTRWTRFPVFTIDRITHRRDPIYHSTYTGRPPDEPAILGVALNEVFVPILQKQFPEIVDFYLPPEGCSYRLAVVSMKKQYPGHAKRVMLGVWSFLRQFMYTKFVIVTDDDVNARDWKDVIWAMTTRMDPARDTVMIENTPIDYLDFASPVSGLGSKIGFDATNKWPGETSREWGRPIQNDRSGQAAGG